LSLGRSWENSIPALAEAHLEKGLVIGKWPAAEPSVPTLAVPQKLMFVIEGVSERLGRCVGRRRPWMPN